MVDLSDLAAKLAELQGEQTQSLETDTEDNSTPEVEQALREIIAELNHSEAQSLDLDADLTEELEITGLALWAVVAEVERRSGRVFLDDEVRTWRTPREILDATR